MRSADNQGKALKLMNPAISMPAGNGWELLYLFEPSHQGWQDGALQ